ncbi:outer membrane protein assembly factor BamB family protein [Aeoliella mucimassa]|uniref:Beta-propeller repeat protein n=1 Tax=Aeoliella mucimassa TaxID=2527972 RepID=A0A518AH94_9BACT|nr:PQQ-binding-like beta-propeller repeat protein [Aeoliella mucimassa]QDU54079.1 Beta-propeller repeat protein [Aeoliella mucimassa]
MLGVYRWLRLFVIGSLVGGAAGLQASPVGPVEWVHQLGTPGNDQGWGLAVDDLGNCVMVSTRAQPPTYGNASRQSYVTMYDAAGEQQWDVLHSPDRSTLSFATDFDAEGNVYIAGHVKRRFDDPAPNLQDVFLAKYTATGEHLWTSIEPLGGDTFISSAEDLVVAPDGSVYLSGYQGGEAFLSRWSSTGNLAWSQTVPRQGFGVLRTSAVEYVSDELIYITGYTEAALTQPIAGERDSFVARFNAQGDIAWVMQRDDPRTDEPTQAAVDEAGNLYVVGATGDGTFSSNDDSLIFKVNASGEELWSQRIEQPGPDFANVIDDLGDGRLLFGGRMTHTLPDGYQTLPYLGVIDDQGTLGPIGTLGAALGTIPFSLAVNQELKSAWITGSTFEGLTDQSFGHSDVFVMRVAVPEPRAVATLAVAGGILLLGYRHGRRARGAITSGFLAGCETACR